MPQPRFVPHSSPVAPILEGVLPPARTKKPSRVATIADVQWPSGGAFGSQGPDQGYVLRLARDFLATLRLDAQDNTEDILAVTSGVALRRASLLGRAPMIEDVTHAFAIWGIQPPGAEALTTFRRQLFSGASHDGLRARAAVALVRDDALALAGDVVKSREDTWRSLFREVTEARGNTEGTDATAEIDATVRAVVDDESSNS